jgi:hypothetical protein
LNQAEVLHDGHLADLLAVRYQDADLDPDRLQALEITGRGLQLAGEVNGFWIEGPRLHP